MEARSEEETEETDERVDERVDERADPSPVATTAAAAAVAAIGGIDTLLDATDGAGVVPGPTERLMEPSAEDVWDKLLGIDGCGC